MFVKTIVKTDRKTGKRYDYYRLCEGYRIGGSVRHRTIISMGLLEGLERKEDRKLLADAIESRLKGEQELFDLPKHIKEYAVSYSGRIINDNLLDIKPVNKNPEAHQEKDIQSIDLNSIKHEEVRELGAEWLCKQNMDKLELVDFLISQGFSKSQAQLAQMHIISRAVYPASERKTADWIKESSAVSTLCEVPTNTVNRHKLYSISNKLYQHKGKIENYLSSKTNNLFDLQDSIIFYDLTNTYFEGRKESSPLAQRGRSKEKRSDAKLVSMATVVNAEGFIKYSRIYQGNIAESSTLEKTIDSLSNKTSSTERKPTIVMDAGILTEDNIKMLKAKGYPYLGVSRSKLKNYQSIEIDSSEEITIYDKKKNPIHLKYVEREGCEDQYLYVRSEQKAVKEASMNKRFCNQYEQELEKIQKALVSKGGTKKIEKVHERIGRLKQKYSTANKHYKIEVIADELKEKAIEVNWTKQEAKPKPDEGVYFLRTSLAQRDEETLWKIYNTLTEIEATFRTLKTDLSLRPVFHKSDENIEAHLFLGTLAYQLVATIRYQLKKKGIKQDWRNIVRKMNTQKEVTTNMRTKSGELLRIKKCSQPSLEVTSIYDALALQYQPYRMKKSVVPEKTQ